MNIFKRFAKSIYSPEDIATYRADKIWKSIIYIILISILIFLPIGYHTATAANDAMKVGADTIKNDIPDFTVEDGKLVSDAKKPITIDQGSVYFYFDSTDSLTTDQIDNQLGSADSAIAFLSDKIYIKAPGVDQSVSYATAGIKSKEDLVNFYQSMEDMSKYFIPILLGIILLAMMFVTFFKVALYALFGFIMSGFGRMGISYFNNWNIAAYSMTLAAVFTIIMYWFQITVPYLSSINMAVSFIIIYLVIRTIPPTDLKQPTK
ncbi:hypothetical protein PWEIH_12180 [Listeria weihenstephanensis FSL R9-0317]|uniref:DUF1189 domain-containing protein n=1 Tax=Listeria weihenstephanensis TaxID=1006155 RepID=A0A1S7FUN6_9LIST|nr:DUF1189 domain-containing protein [Listeria weihenstephanensis]AQY51161.1 membrane protein [Listeria weihenstephanensis]EUJ36909.1 hypothetical protein PWEIH_12180 [Listeria weihenstephanensis FSL R9-0317]MBC1501794.1 DUF1189 domain-containing protein [Listeria weihenstephanensis]